jgi:hypothetical protein
LIIFFVFFIVDELYVLRRFFPGAAHVCALFLRLKYQNRQTSCHAWQFRPVMPAFATNNAPENMS